MLMEDEQRWRALPQEEQAEQEQALGQNGALHAARIQPFCLFMWCTPLAGIACSLLIMRVM